MHERIKEHDGDIPNPPPISEHSNATGHYRSGMRLSVPRPTLVHPWVK